MTDESCLLAVVGCGNWGQNLVRNFHALGALAAVADRNEAVARDIAGRYGVPARLLTEILADPAIDGVVIAAPAAQHFSIARECLLANKHVFVEKPLALEVDQAVELCRLAGQMGRVLMVGHLLRYHPAFLALKDLCDGGQLGRLRYVSSHRLNLGRFRNEENILWSFAPHDISMILSLLGREVEDVRAVGHSYLHKAIADVTTTHMRFQGGQAAHIHVSWLHPIKEQKLVVVGEDGMAVFDDGLDWDRKLQLYPHKITWSEGVPHSEKATAQLVPLTAAEPLRLECAHFLDAITGVCAPLTDGDEGLVVLRVLDAAERSMASGRAVTLKPAAPARPGIHPSAVIEPTAEIGEGTRIWHFSHVLDGSRVGRDCTIGQNVVIGPDVRIGDRCKIQNNVSVYAGVTLEEGVFCGPSMVFTNVATPRAEINRKHEFLPTLVRRGASIGANATVICGHTVGRWALVGAGAVVTRDVPDHALVVGNPARVIGWVCVCGVRLPHGEWDETRCPACGKAYRHADGVQEIEADGVKEVVT